MKSLIYLGKNEKPFHPEIGGGIYDFLFENIAEDHLDKILENRIKQVLSTYEPRAEIRGVNVQVSPERNGFEISVYFVVLNTLTPVTLDLFLKTVR
jgi:predicted component of type VI protein secretion system